MPLIKRNILNSDVFNSIEKKCLQCIQIQRTNKLNN